MSLQFHECGLYICWQQLAKQRRYKNNMCLETEHKTTTTKNETKSSPDFQTS